MKFSLFNRNSSQRQEEWVDLIMNFMYWVVRTGVIMILIYSTRFIWNDQKVGQNILNLLSSFSFGALIGGASFLIGGFIAFLFAIPKVLQPGTNESGTSKEFSYLHNDNLVQISDWLTKIIVGVGLTQVNEIPEQLTKLGLRVKPVFGGDAIGEVVGITIVLYFLTAGFLWSYLWSRLHLIQLFKWVEDGLKEKFDQAKKTIARQEETLEGMVGIAGLDNRSLENKNASDSSDPEKGQWGGLSAANDRVVTAQVHQTSWNEKYYEIFLEVKSTNPSKPLTGQVIFHLHPSFPNPIMPVMTANGVAKLRLVGRGAFTVGVETDSQVNKLEIDLSQLPDAPARFKEL